jgi:hypothetical protein
MATLEQEIAVTQRRLGAGGSGGLRQSAAGTEQVSMRKAANGAVCGPFPSFAGDKTMSRVYTTSALIALMLGLATAAYAATGQSAASLDYHGQPPGNPLAR